MKISYQQLKLFSQNDDCVWRQHPLQFFLFLFTAPFPLQFEGMRYKALYQRPHQEQQCHRTYHILWFCASKSDAKSTQAEWGDQQQFCPLKSTVMTSCPWQGSLGLGGLSCPFEPLFCGSLIVWLYFQWVFWGKWNSKYPISHKSSWPAVSQQVSLLQPQFPPREPCPGSVVVISTAVQT